MKVRWTKKKIIIVKEGGEKKNRKKRIHAEIIRNKEKLKGREKVGGRGWKV